MKFIQKKSRLFYLSLVSSLLFSTVRPSQLELKRSGSGLMATLFSISWGAGPIVWGGLAGAASLISLLRSADNNNTTKSAPSQRSSRRMTQDELALYGSPHEPAPLLTNSSSQQEYSFSSKDAVDAMKGAFISVKSISNAYNSFCEDASYSGLDDTTSNYTDVTYSQSDYGGANRKVSFSSKDFLDCICPDWSSRSYERYLVERCGFSRGESLDKQLPEHIKRDLFQNLALYERPGYIKFLATLTCPQDLQRVLICTESLYKYAHVLELYKTFDCYEQYLPVLYEKSYLKHRFVAEPLGRAVHDICMKKIEISEWDRLEQHECYAQKELSEKEAQARALQKFRPELLEQLCNMGAICSDLTDLFKGNYLSPGKYYKASRSVRNIAQGHGVTINRKLEKSDTFKSRLQVATLSFSEEVHAFYKKNKHNPLVKIVVPQIEKWLVTAFSQANENHLESSFALFNTGFVTFKLVTGSVSDGLSYGVGAFLPEQCKRELYQLYCLYPVEVFRKLIRTIGSYCEYHQSFSEQTGAIGKQTADKNNYACEINEYIKKYGLWDKWLTPEQRESFDIRDVLRKEREEMGISEEAEQQGLWNPFQLTTDLPSRMYEDCKKHIIEPVDEAPSQEREPTAAELIAERGAQKALQQKKEMLQQPINSIVHPKSADCGQKTSNLQAEQLSSVAQEIQKTDSQTDSELVRAAHELQQAVYAQAASEHQKGLDLYGDRLTDAQRTRYENRRDAFLEVYNNPDQNSEYTYTLPAESQRMLQAAGINIFQFMSGSGDALERLVHHEQQQIAGKLQEYALQMPEGKERNVVLREMLSNMRHANALQQCGLHQLSLIPIDQNWMLIDSIDQFGFGILDQLPEQYGLGCFVYDVAYGCLVKGPVNAANLIYLAVSNIPATIKASARLVADIDALGSLALPENRQKGAATLALLSCGVPESALKDQMAHWSEQQRTEAAVCVEQARERLQSIANNPIPTTIYAIGNHLAHDAASAGVTTYNILYGLSCMEAACETFDKDLELKLFEQGEQLLRENLPTAQQTAEFAGEMLFWHYGPGLIKKGASAAYDKLAERIATRLEQGAARAGKILEPTIELMPNKPMVPFLTDAEIDAMVRDMANASLTEDMLFGKATLIERRVTPEVMNAARPLAKIVAVQEAGVLVGPAEECMAGMARKPAAVQTVKAAKRNIFVVEDLTGDAAVEQAARIAELSAQDSGIIFVNKKKALERAVYVEECAEKIGASLVEALEKEACYKFGESEFGQIFDAEGYSVLRNSHKKAISQREQICKSFFAETKETCKMFIKERAQALQALKDEIGIAIKDGLDWTHIYFGNAKGNIKGFHDITYCPETVIKVLEVHEHSMEVVVGIIKGKPGQEVLLLDVKTIFMPGTTKGEIDRLFNKACINIEISEFKPDWGSWTVISKPIDGQRYQWYVDAKGVIKSFFPINQVK